MKKTILIFALGLSVLTGMTAYAATEESLDSIVAVVNDDIVTKTELNHALKIAKLQIAHENFPEPPEKVLQKQVLTQLIHKKIQLQVAKQAGVKVTDADLDKAISNIAEQNNMSTADFYKRITQEGMNKKEYRNEIKDQIALNKLQQQEVVRHITISPDEVSKFLQSQLWQSNGTKEYRLEDILIPVPDAPTSQQIEQAKAHATAVMAKLKNGQNFREAAQAESGDKSALQGGDLGWRKLPEIPSVFAEQVAQMKAKEIAGPIQAPNGFHIIKLADVRTLSTEKKTPDRKEVENLLMQRKFEEALQNWVSKLRSQAFVVENV